MLVSASPKVIPGWEAFTPKMLVEGVFQLPPFNFTGSIHFPEFDDAEIGRSEYGVADSVEQIVSHYPEVNNPNREFIITVTEVRREDQPSKDGWRWHKWGSYIGTHEPQCEYLYDEQGIDQVLVYHILERRN